MRAHRNVITLTSLSEKSCICRKVNMMVPSKSLIIAGAALCTLGAVSSAQQSGKVYQRYNKPLTTVSLDLETGVVTRGPAVQQQAAGTVSDFSNIDLSGFIAVDTGSCFCAWFDAGVKGHNGNASDLMNNIVFAYCSSAQDVASGGPGGSASIGFYEGYSTGGATPSTTVAAFTINGLPANTGSSSFFGNFNCFFINVGFANLVCFADGQVGYSWKFLDGTGAGTLAQTWPFLSCVQSCSGVQDQGGTGGPNLQDLLIDQYCPPGFLRSTFNFGTVAAGGGSPFYISLSMDMREAADCASTIVSNNGQGINLDVQTAPAAVINAPWSSSVAVNDPANPPNGALVLLFNPNSLAVGPRISLSGGPTTELLIGPAGLAQPCPIALYGGGGGVVCNGTVIPKDFNLIGSNWCTQVVVGTPAAGFTFTNSQCGTVGTF
jgi:hypothetical protein